MIENIKKKHILVVGDVMIDNYYIGKVKRISPEAPVPVFRKSSERSVLGGAANVAINLKAAGQDVSIMTIVGNDTNGKLVIKLLDDAGIDRSLVDIVDRDTTIKTRFIASNNQQVMRLDVENTKEIEDDLADNFLWKLSASISTFDVIVISDYLKGFLTYRLTQGIIQLANKNNKKVIIDVKDPKYDKYSNCFLLKPNLSELKMLTGLDIETDEDIVKAAELIKENINCEYVLVTLGAKGMLLIGEDLKYKVESVGQEVFDVTGAGDTTIAYLSVGIANDLKICDAVEISNYAAGIQVAKVGTSAVYISEVEEFLKSGKQGVIHKLINIENVNELRDRNRNKKIVFTNGCFDILHVGHIRYLQEASKLGDILIIGLNSDSSVKMLKGEERPINNQKDRAELLCALEYVDYVVVFDEETPYELIKLVQPDVLVKGGDYKPENVVGKDIVEARNGELVLIDFVEGKSTTKIINKMKELSQRGEQR